MTSRRAIKKCQLIINCTSMGDLNNPNENPMKLCNNDNLNTYYYDVIYQPEETSFLKQISNCSLKMNGLGMNKLQALIGFSKCHPGYSPKTLSDILDEKNL